MESSSSSSNTKIKQQKPKQVHNNKTKTTTAWKSESTQQAYSTKLLRALTQHRQAPIRQTADCILAATARGRTRWSRALITNRVHLKLLQKKHRRSRMGAANEARWSPKKMTVEMVKMKAKNVTCVRRKVKVLSRLVPGCKKESLPTILEEVVDYIPALEMQVRAMRDILSRLSLVGAENGDVADEGLGLELPVPENGVV